jgi:hypothetical protein
MALRTYEPGLIFAAKTCRHYCTKWLPQLQSNLTEPQLAALNALISCLQALLLAMGSE